jgi:hypothetical protein
VLIRGGTYQLKKRFSLGPVFTLKFGMWTGDRIGFFCWNDHDERGHLDVNWFRYDYDGPKAGRCPLETVP